jgi:hypothetical protein
MTMQRFHFGQQNGPAGRRQAARVRLALPGKVITITGHEPCQLDDLSQTGACITLAGAAPPLGDDVVMMVQGAEAFGTVVWRRGSSFGLAFDEPLAKSEVVRLRAVHDHFQALEHEQNLRRARDFVQGRRFY